MGIIRILHLSDLHISSACIDSADFKSFYSGLLKGIEELHDIPDCVVVTGDIINKGNTDDYENVKREFFEKLCSELKYTPNMFLFAAGNHDIKREDYITDKVAKANNKKQRNKPFLESVTQGDVQTHFLSRFKPFCKFYKDFTKDNTLGNNSYGIKDVTLANKTRVRFIILNSSICSYGDDYKKIGLMKQQLENLCKLVSKKQEKPDITIALMHHPMDWFRNDERRLAQGYFEDKSQLGIDIILHGHTHEGRVYGSLDIDSCLVSLVSGVGYTKQNSAVRSYKNYRFAFYSIDTDKEEISGKLLIANEKNVFMPDTSTYRSISKDGKFTIKYGNSKPSMNNSAPLTINFPVDKPINITDNFINVLNTQLDSVWRFRNYVSQHCQAQQIEIRQNLKEIGLITRKSTSEDKKKIRALKQEYLRDFLFIVAQTAKSCFFGDYEHEEVRVHFRIYRKDLGEHIKFTASCDTPLHSIKWSINHNLIYFAYLNGRSLIKSMNPELAFDTGGEWVDYMTVPLYEFNSIKIPPLSLGISIKGERTEELLRILEALCFLRLERYMQYILREFSTNVINIEKIIC